MESNEHSLPSTEVRRLSNASAEPDTNKSHTPKSNSDKPQTSLETENSKLEDTKKTDEPADDDEESEPELKPEAQPEPVPEPEPELESIPISPATSNAHASIPLSPPLPTEVLENESTRVDSLVTVRLSEPPVLVVETIQTTVITKEDVYEDEPDTPTAPEGQRATIATMISSEAGSDEVNWEQLQQTENEESDGQDADMTALLLARLEQENAKLETNPKSVKVHGPEAHHESMSSRPRPPSMAQLHDMVHGPTPPALRYSMLPPPPLTDLEFYAALVQDYQQTASRLPTLLTNKIRKGIPPPLRGVVWQGMTGAAQDMFLASQFERFCDESSPYEGIIGKDLGRSFPGVDMFREPDGDGQRMLGRVLKSYSLHDPSIGYCQGLAFLVGPLLMHMPDKEAFCVLVKLMENYDLRSSYTPELSGLHVRIFQFRELLQASLPDVSSHLDDLQVDPAAYVSQWFLSFFAVTCPLPMLFRMYDVLFAEGAVETIMRVALSLMHGNQARLLACAELEDAMQLLLSRSLWDCYHYNADDFVLHFLGLTTVVTREKLASLEQTYHEAQIAHPNQTGSANVDHSSTIATTASRFLGRLWVSSSSSASPSASTSSSFPSPTPSSANPTASSSSPSSNNNNTPSPSSSSNSLPLPRANSNFGGIPLRPLSMLRRSASKQSIASTLNSMEATSTTSSNNGPLSSASTSSSSSSVLSSISTEATSLSHDATAADTKAVAATTTTTTGATAHGAPVSKSSDNDRYLNSQIEDLLTALSDLQRQHALLTDQLQREREDRTDDRKAVRTLLRRLRQKAEQPEDSSEPVDGEKEIEEEADAAKDVTVDDTSDAAAAGTPGDKAGDEAAEKEEPVSQEELSTLLEAVENRFSVDIDNRRSSVPQTKLQLRNELARAKELLENEVAKSQDGNRRIYDLEQELNTVKEQLRDSHSHARSLHQDKQRLERQLHDMRTRVASTAAEAAVAAAAGANQITHSAATTSGNSGHGDSGSDWFGRSKTASNSSPGGNGGLRELKLGRSKSTPAQNPALGAANTQPPVYAGAGKRTSSMMMRGIPARRESVFNTGATSPAASTVGTAGATGSSESNRNSDRDSNGNNMEQMEQQQETLVLELVQAKTAEAVARQEAEEAKQKLESLRKALGLSSNDMASVLHNASSAGASSQAATAAMGVLGRLTATSENHGGHSNAKAGTTPSAPGHAPASSTSSGYGGFFSWRR